MMLLSHSALSSLPPVLHTDRQLHCLTHSGRTATTTITTTMSISVTDTHALLQELLLKATKK